MISSTAEADRNHFSTGSLDAESVENVSRWSGTGASVAGGYYGGESLSNAAQSSAVAAGHVDLDETSTTQSVITGNIDVQSGSTTGVYSTDRAGANGHLDNDFNASSVNTTIQTQIAAETAGETAVELIVQAYEAANKASGSAGGGGGKKGTSGQTGQNTGQGGDGTASSTAPSLSGDQALTGAHHDAYPIDTADPTDPSQSGTRTDGQTATRYTQSNGDEAITVAAHPGHPYQPSAGLDFSQGMSDAEFAQWFFPEAAGAMSIYNTGKDVWNGDYKGAAWESLTGWGLGPEAGAAGKVAGKVVALGLKEIQAAAKAAREKKAAGSVLNNTTHNGEGAKGGAGTSGEPEPSTNREGSNGKPSIHNSMVDLEHIAELEKNGVKFSKEKLVATGRLPDGKVFFLEEGTKASGLEHIVVKHGFEFKKKGIAQSDIPKVISQALSEGKIVGYQGEGTGRPIFQTTVNGSELNIAITVSEDGYIVGANMKGARKWK